MHLTLQRFGTWPRNQKTMCTQRLLAVSAAVLAVSIQQSLAVPAALRAVSTRRSLAVPVVILVLPAGSTSTIPHCHKVTTEPSRQIEGIQSFKSFFARCLNEKFTNLEFRFPPLCCGLDPPKTRSQKANSFTTSRVLLFCDKLIFTLINLSESFERFPCENFPYKRIILSTQYCSSLNGPHDDKVVAGLKVELLWSRVPFLQRKSRSQVVIFVTEEPW
jgi:hypothetical protein